VKTSVAPRSTVGRAGEVPAAIPGEPLRPADAADPVASAVAATEAASRATATRTSASTAATTTHSPRGRVKIKPDSLLATRAQDEYVYVGQDLRRIVVVAVGLYATLIVLWLFFTIVDPFGIY